MRQRNMRLVMVGIVLAILAVGFFYVMMGMAPKSNDPAELMRTVGMVSGGAGGLGIVMAIIGLVGKKTA